MKAGEKVSDIWGTFDSINWERILMGVVVINDSEQKWQRAECQNSWVQVGDLGSTIHRSAHQQMAIGINNGINKPIEKGPIIMKFAVWGEWRVRSAMSGVLWNYKGEVSVFDGALLLGSQRVHMWLSSDHNCVYINAPAINSVAAVNVNVDVPPPPPLSLLHVTHDFLWMHAATWHAVSQSFSRLKERKKDLPPSLWHQMQN